MLTRVVPLAAVFSLAACVDTPDEPALGAADPAATKCPTCDDNGLPPGSWQQAPLQLAPTALGPAGLTLPGGAIRPLCAPGTPLATSTSCALAPEWIAWVGTDPVRSDLLRYIIRVAAGKGDLVSNPRTGSVTAGAFGLARSALTLPWNDRVQSIITGGMAVNVDYYANAVEICIKTEFTADCPAAYAYQELAAAGNLFAGRAEVIIGGHAANAPDESQRVCPSGLAACNHYSARTLYSGATCGYAGATAQRYPTTCTDPAGGPAFDYPVQVFTTWNPATMGAAPYGGPML